MELKWGEEDTNNLRKIVTRQIIAAKKRPRRIFLNSNAQKVSPEFCQTETESKDKYQIRCQTSWDPDLYAFRKKFRSLSQNEKKWLRDKKIVP